MEITSAQRVHIKDAFSKMKWGYDLLLLLNYVKPIVYGDNTKPFTEKQLNKYYSPKIKAVRYVPFEIKKKSGKIRTIHAPVKELKAIQKCLNLILQVMHTPHAAATGFVPNKSIVDNARLHIGSNYIYNIDLKDFFPSIDQARVWRALQLPPFNLEKPKTAVAALEPPIDEEEVLYNGPLTGINTLKPVNMIAAIVCAAMEVDRLNESGEWIKILKNVLPQGAPTSPTITNIICERLDKKLQQLARRYNLKYTRYADDITFSSMHHVYQKDSEFITALHKIIKAERFHINEAKTRLQKRGYRQEVTGLLVNDKVNVPARFVKRLRGWLYLWERYGYNKAQSIFSKDYDEDRTDRSKPIPNMENVIYGKLQYMGMVKGKTDSTYKKLQARFDALIKNLPQMEGEKTNLDEVLDALLNKTLAEALKLYQP